MIPGVHSIEAKKGATFARTFILENPDGSPVNLSGFTAAMQVRAGDDENAAVLLDLTTANGKLVLGGAAGTVNVTETAANMAALSPEPRMRAPGTTIAWYDLKLTSPAGTVNVWLEGEFRITERVTV